MRGRFRVLAVAVAVLAGCSSGAGDGDDGARPDLAGLVTSTTTTAPPAPEPVPAGEVCAEYDAWLDDLEGDVPRELFYPWLERFAEVDDPDLVDLAAGYTPGEPWETTNGRLLDISMRCALG